MKQDMRQLILEQVKEGKLTIDEALDKLERLESIDERATSASEHKYVDEPEQYDRVDQYSVDSLTTKVMSAFDNLVSRIKDSDLSLNQASGPNVTYVKQFPFSGETVHVDLFNANLVVEPSDLEECELTVTGRPLRRQQVTEEQALEQLQAAVQHAVSANTLSIRLKDKSVRATVHLKVPRRHYESFVLQTLNGEISLSSLDTTSAQLMTANGRVNVRDLFSEDVKVSTANGSIEIEESELKVLKAKTANGQIITTGVFERSELKTANGNVRCELKTAQNAKVKASSLAGSIALMLPHGAEVYGELETNFGGLNCNLDDMELIRDQKEIVNRKLHFVSGRGRSPKIEVEADTKTGTISVTHGVHLSPQAL
ncbi:DUF4097 family beta strand repeat-containing protein [Exiguobacterium acetylicum]|uniref:DUF4097 family beta strand repeat-containing protein n=3 Tax=Bacillales Family XII. Incertae Sedis TaxID=539742 RepID=UPI0006AA48F0|nr:DUF4097 family beta strand repeat-containing protein [Exiguobacterium sp. BMC-KP]KOP30145.1 hypothetical protein ADM98_15040 [Exiguobacterium sp. BMC-KP]